MKKKRKVVVVLVIICLLLGVLGLACFFQVFEAATHAAGVPDSTPPTITIGPNGAPGVKVATTTVTVLDTESGVLSSSLQYVWDTQNGSAPSTGWTAFTNTAALTYTGLTGTCYLWVRGSDKAGNTSTVVSNAFIINNTVTVTKNDTVKAYIVTPAGTVSPVDIAAPVVLAAQHDGYALVIDHPLARLVIPAEVVKNDMTMSGTDKLSLSIESVPKTDILNNLQATDKSILSIGNLCSFAMNVARPGNIQHPVTTFAVPLAITIKHATGYKVPTKTSVFHIVPTYDASGTLKTVASTYAGGNLNRKTAEMTFYTDHFSYYLIAERSMTFPDIATSWAHTAIEVLASRKIVAGSAGYFHPAADVKRVDFSILMNNVLAKKPEVYSAIFKDVAPSDYFAGQILSLNTYGILDVHGGTCDHPATFGVYADLTSIFKNMTRGQAATFLANGYTYVKSYIPQLPEVAQTAISYPDVSSQTSIQTVTALGIMRGYPNGTFQPDKTITREETAQIMYLFLQKTDGMAKVYDNSADVG